MYVLFAMIEFPKEIEEIQLTAKKKKSSALFEGCFSCSLSLSSAAEPPDRIEYENSYQNQKP